MKEIVQQLFTGERALFMSRDLILKECTFDDGESPLKESKDIEMERCIFKWKYPLWYCENIAVKDSTWLDMARAGVWYTNNITVEDCTIEAPKNFRRVNKLKLKDVNFPNAAETLWSCEDVEMENITAKGDYFAMNCHGMRIRNFMLDGNYGFDGAKDVEIHNARMLTKDAFWNCENVIVYDSTIIGEYLGWNSKNITFINCTIDSLQGMCYMENVTMKNCRLLNTNLAFEYSTVDAEIESSIDSIKNPIGGKISAKSIREQIWDDPNVDKAATDITLKMESSGQ